MTDPSPLEKAARALAERWLERDQARAVEGGCDINLVIDAYLPEARKDARAVLEAVRPPTEAMQNAGAETIRVGTPEHHPFAIAGAAWCRMIDAILSQGDR